MLHQSFWCLVAMILLLKGTRLIIKSVGKVALFTSSFPSSPRPWPNVDQNVNVCAGNCSLISQH